MNNTSIAIIIVTFIFAILFYNIAALDADMKLATSGLQQCLASTNKVIWQKECK